MPEKFSPQPTPENGNKKKWVDELKLEKTRKIVLSFVYKLQMGFSPVDAENIAQQVLLRAFEKIDQFKGGSLPQLSAWLYQITKNISLRALEQNNHDFSLDTDALPPDHNFTSKEPTSEDRSITAERLRNLRLHLSKLSEKLQEVMKLIIEEDLNSKEIGERLGINPITARTRYTKAKGFLKEWMQEEDKK